MGQKSRLKKLRRQERLAGTTRKFREAAQQLAETLGGEDRATVVHPPPGLPRVSERMLELAGPLLHAAEGQAAVEGIIGFCAVAWNVAVLEAIGQHDMVDRVLKEFMTSQEHEPELAGLIRSMATRKKELFPDDCRFIAQYDLSFSGREPHLQVASVLLED